MMPAETNPHGTIFGGTILSHLDLAGSVAAQHEIRQAGWPHQQTMLVGMDRVEFHRPVLVGDIVSFWATLKRVGRTSITVHVLVEADRKGDLVRVTEADVTYVTVELGDGRAPSGWRLFRFAVPNSSKNKRNKFRFTKGKVMNVLVIDIGGAHVKLLATGQTEVLKIPSGPDLTPQRMVADVLEATKGWSYDAVSIGFPGPIASGKAVREPKNLGTGWVEFDLSAALGRPVKFVNDAAMQALGSYEGGRMLFLGLGTGLGTTLVLDSKTLVPMEAGHLPYRKGRTFEDHIGQRGIDRFGRKKWREFVDDVVTRLRLAFVADYVVLGGGNARLIKKLPEHARLGKNENAFLGGFRLWENCEHASLTR